jgi:hypothetical protein
MLCALVKNNLVSEILEVSSDEQFQSIARQYSNVIDITNANPRPAIGWVFNGNALIPGEGQSAVPTRKITKLALRNRFTFTELCALTAAAKTIVQVEALMDNLAVSTFIDLNRPDVIGGIEMLVAFGLITPERATQILNGPVTAIEEYKGE